MEKKLENEYNGEDDTLIFEGKYLNGQRNGQGKKYLLDKLLFEGDYINGQKNGKGKEYYLDFLENNKLQFEGEYLNGKRNGKGKEYDKDGKLRFEGEYLNDKEWIGNRYDDNGNILYTLNNNINGNGKEYYDGKLFFEVNI